MASTLVTDAPGVAVPAVKKLRKKQAKREAALMLDIEQAKKQVEKAAQKLAKAQSKLEGSQKSLQREEERLVQLRTKGQQKLDEVLAKYVSEPAQSNGQVDHAQEPVAEGAQEASQLPVDQTSTTSTESATDQQPADNVVSEGSGGQSEQ